MEEVKKLRRKLVEFHVINTNPDYLYGHVCVAASIINLEIVDLESYMQQCAKYGISRYETTAARYFKAFREDYKRTS